MPQSKGMSQFSICKLSQHLVDVPWRPVVFIFVDVTQGKRIMPAVAGFLDLDVDEDPQPDPEALVNGVVDEIIAEAPLSLV
jgi:hypothetical protein